jgi:hypothetical protein
VCVEYSCVNDAVDSISKEQFLSSDDDTLLEHVFAQLSIDPIILYEESKVMEQREIKIESVPGVLLIISIPYSGDPKLWRLIPSHFKNVHTDALVHPLEKDGIGFVDITIKRRTNADQQEVKQSLDKQLEFIKSSISHQSEDINGFHPILRGAIQRAVQARRERLKTQDGLANALGIPLKKREGTPDILSIAVKRKLVRPLSAIPKEGSKRERDIAEEDYEFILSVIRHEGRTFEATPKTYAIHVEEELRDILLAHLNGHYQGDATGETFRKNGKTDIRIEADSRAAFVAECKIWRGAKEIVEAIDQLLSYLTWRDCKAAFIVFNKDVAGFTELLNKFPETMKKHSCYIKDTGNQGSGEWRFIFRSSEDKERMITIHAFLFNLYVKPYR